MDDRQNTEPRWSHYNSELVIVWIRLSNFIRGSPCQYPKSFNRNARAHVPKHLPLDTNGGPNDVVFWDNRSLMHYAVQKYDLDNHRRHMQRTTVSGDRLY